jgi:hypothetical protein
MVMARPDSRSRSLQGRSQQRGSPRLLHHLAALLSLAGQRAGTKENCFSRATREVRPSAAQRRRRQHLALAQRLLDPLPPALLPADRQGEHFWRALRWGGMGLLLALWLSR